MQFLESLSLWTYLDKHAEPIKTIKVYDRISTNKILFSNNIDKLENIRKRLINSSRKSSLFNMKKYTDNFSVVLREIFNSCRVEN